jgi:signal peptidase I
MRNLCVGTVLSFCCVTTFAVATELVTVAEESGFTRTSLYADVVEFVEETARRSDSIRLGQLGRTAEGRVIPLVIVSEDGIATPHEARLLDLPSVLIIANIHAGEIEGKEALQMFLRDVVEGKVDELLTNQLLLVVPIFNADGNDKLGDNRGDNGPELAGIRYNGQNLDLNRDFVKLETPEVNGLMRLIRDWEPVLFVDMHTTNGSYHREPVTYTTMAGENSSDRLKDYMWQQFFPAVAVTLKTKYGYDSLPYGNFNNRAEPEEGWSNHAFAARYSTNAIGLRNIFTVLDENYSHADFKTRVLSSYGFVHSILEYTQNHIEEMAKIVREESLQTRSGFREQGWVTEFTVAKLKDITIKSYEFEIEQIPESERHKYPWARDGVLVKRTETLRDYTVPYFNRTVPTVRLDLPEAYVIPAVHKKVIKKLGAHGIIVDCLEDDLTATVEQYQIEKLEPANRPNQGHVTLAVEGKYEKKELTLAAGSYVVSMRQPLARMIPVLLEPSSADSLLRWGFFSSSGVPQWSRRFIPYPVVRLASIPPGTSLEVRKIGDRP